MREALSLHHVRFDSHERLECFSVHDYRKKKLWQSSVWEITRFTMNRLRNSQTMSDEENNDRKFSSLVREGGELPMLRFERSAPPWGPDPYHPFHIVFNRESTFPGS